MSLALIIGNPGIGNPVAEVFLRIARDFFQVHPTPVSPDRAIMLLSAPEHSKGPNLVLYCKPRLEELMNGLPQLSPPARVIVYGPDLYTVDRAVEFCRDGLASDYFVIGDTSTPLSRYEEHIRAVARRECPYPEFQYPLAGTWNGQPMVFRSTPFDNPVQRGVMDAAVGPAIRAAGFGAHPLEEHRPGLLDGNVRSRVQSSQLLIANVCTRNTSVAREIAWAEACQVPCIRIRKKGRCGEPDAESRGYFHFEYAHEIELALWLYHGLRHFTQAPEQSRAQL